MKHSQHHRQQSVTHRSHSRTESPKTLAGQSKQKAQMVAAKQCIRHREGNSRRSLEITMDVQGVMGEIVREMATAEEAITDSDQEEEAVAQTETETSVAISKLQFHRCVKREGRKKGKFS
jgi:hypothetical protein